jgi:hypothetical protein
MPPSLIRGAELLSPGGRIVTVLSTVPPRAPLVVGSARLLVDEACGLGLPREPAEVDRALTTRFGAAAVELVGAIRRRCPADLADPVLGSVLVELAPRVVCAYRRTR